MSNQIDDGVHCFQLQYQTTPSISDADGLKSKHYVFKFQHYLQMSWGQGKFLACVGPLRAYVILIIL